jgi:hypothetical protein
MYISQSDIIFIESWKEWKKNGKITNMDNYYEIVYKIWIVIHR